MILPDRFPCSVATDPDIEPPRTPRVQLLLDMSLGDRSNDFQPYCLLFRLCWLDAAGLTLMGPNASVSFLQLWLLALLVFSGR